MNSFLLDTNVLSEFARTKDADQNVRQWLTLAETGSLFTSVLVIAEIRRGIELLPPGRRRNELREWLVLDLIPSFTNPLLTIDQRIADRWAFLSADAKKEGRSLPIIDGLIAATAIEHDLTIVTRNTRHFEGLGIRLLNPWLPLH